LARTVKNPKIDTRSARLALPVRREPYWTVISAGSAIGYRRGPGTWIARLRDDDGKQRYEALGAADDARDADGLTVLNFQQAQAKARDFFKVKVRELSGDYMPEDGPFTVAMALDAYFAERERRGSKALYNDRAAARLRILPQLGEVEVPRLTTKRLRDWQAEIAKAEHRGVAADDDDIRARRATPRTQRA
jgi:hypothetical protein